MKRIPLSLLFAVLILITGIGGIGIISSSALATLPGESLSDLPPRPTPNLTPTSPPGDPEDPYDTGLPGFWIPRQPGDQGQPSLSNLDLNLRANLSQARIGETIIYAIHLINSGPTKATGVEVLGLLPSGMEVLQVTSNQGSVNYNPASHRVKVFLGVLQPGTEISITINVWVSQSAVPGVMYYCGAKVIQGNATESNQQFSNWVRVEITE